MSFINQLFSFKRYLSSRAPPNRLDSPVTNLKIKNLDDDFVSVSFDREPSVLNALTSTLSDLNLCHFVVVANGQLFGDQILPHSGQLPRFSDQCFELARTATPDTTTPLPVTTEPTPTTTTPFVLTFDYAVNFTINQTFNEAYRNNQSQQYENLGFLISVYVSLSYILPRFSLFWFLRFLSYKMSGALLNANITENITGINIVNLESGSILTSLILKLDGPVEQGLLLDALKNGNKNILLVVDDSISVVYLESKYMI